jgi:glycosyltransferase involved in cell wall biosynthesis
MKLLIVTQKVDRNDPVLGFFHGWLIEFAKHVEKLHVICLEMGEFDLPGNVSVHSLGKEEGSSRFKYVWRFYKYIFLLKNEYDSVFVHMNQEYVLLGGIFWKKFGKKIFLWRNHAQGSIFTRFAVLLSDKVFCTSEQSFTAKFNKTKIMPVGVDTNMFTQRINQVKENTFLVLGRVDPVKRLEDIIEAVSLLKEKGIVNSVHIVGDPKESNRGYKVLLQDIVRKKGLEQNILFFPGVPYSEASSVYGRYNLFINVTPSGSLDKTIFEAISSGLIPVVANQFFRGVLPDGLVINNGNSEILAEALEYAISITKSIPPDLTQVMKSISQKHSLQNLSLELMGEMSL